MTKVGWFFVDKTEEVEIPQTNKRRLGNDKFDGRRFDLIHTKPQSHEIIINWLLLYLHIFLLRSQFFEILQQEHKNFEVVHYKRLTNNDESNFIDD